MNQKAIDLYEDETGRSWYGRRNNEFIAEDLRCESDEFLVWLGKRAEMAEYSGHKDDCSALGNLYDPKCTCGFSEIIGPPLAINAILDAVTI
jgi:hypothetical protein